VPGGRLNNGGMMAANLLSRRKRAKADADPILRAFDDRVLVLPPCDLNCKNIKGPAYRIVSLPMRVIRITISLRSGKSRLHTLEQQMIREIR
jgi:hypothetical protein